jgi:hypothetical protein
MMEGVNLTKICHRHFCKCHENKNKNKDTRSHGVAYSMVTGQRFEVEIVPFARTHMHTWVK